MLKHQLSSFTDYDLQRMRDEAMAKIATIDHEQHRRQSEKTALVAVTKIAEGHFLFKHPTKGEFEAKNVANGRRYRVWQRVQGARGMKRGEVVIGEALIGIQGIREHIATRL